MQPDKAIYYIRRAADQRDDDLRLEVGNGLYVLHCGQHTIALAEADWTRLTEIAVALGIQKQQMAGPPAFVLPNHGPSVRGNS